MSSLSLLPISAGMRIIDVIIMMYTKRGGEKDYNLPLICFGELLPSPSSDVAIVDFLMTS